jgi:hypothetical protein
MTHKNKNQLTSVSIAFAAHRTAEDKLDMLNTTRMKRTLSEAIKNAEDLAWMVGGIDLSLNDDTQKKQDVAWQPQFYGFVQVPSREDLSKLLRDRHRTTKIAPRPVKTKDCDGSARAISYGFKNDFVRRIAYRGQGGPPGNRRKFWTTRKVSLRATEHGCSAARGRQAPVVHNKHFWANAGWKKHRNVAWRVYHWNSANCRHAYVEYNGCPAR